MVHHIALEFADEAYNELASLGIDNFCHKLLLIGALRVVEVLELGRPVTAAACRHHVSFQFINVIFKLLAMNHELLLQ